MRKVFTRLKEERFYLGTILLVALVIRVLFVTFMPLEPYSDELVYDTIARNLASGGGFSSTLGAVPDSVRPPGFPFLLAGIYYFFGYSHLAVKLVLSLFSALLCLFIYFIAAEVFHRRVAIISSLIAVIYPFFIYYTGRLLTETLFVFLLALAILSFIKVIKTYSFRHAILTGGLLALAILTRPVLFLFPLVIFLAIFFTRGLKTKPKRLRSFTAIFCTVLALLAPWTIRNYRLHQEFVPVATIGGSTFWGANNPQIRDGGWVAGFTPLEFQTLSEVKRSKGFYQMGFDFIKENPACAFRRAFLKIGRLWSLYPHTTRRDKLISLFSYGLLVPFSILGMVYALKRWREVSIFYLTFLYFTGMSMIFYGSTRFRLPIEPYFIIFGALGIDYVIRRIERQKGQGKSL
jgi:4-amino-4-deoxy-L-arabinose transferase-like glycosyltransferase